MKTKLFVILSLIAVVLLCVIVHYNTADSINLHYYLKHDYKNSTELFNALPNLTNRHNAFFLWCCDCILFYAKQYNMSYEELNIYLFVIIQPYLIVLFIGLYISKVIETRRLCQK
jgi:hypothetical protein